MTDPLDPATLAATLRGKRCYFPRARPNQSVSSVVITEAERDAIVTALERLATPPTCEWREDENGIWQTGCGHSFFFDTDGPTENQQKFCGYCGAMLKPVYLPAPPSGDGATGDTRVFAHCPRCRWKWQVGTAEKHSPKCQRTSAGDGASEGR